MSFTTAGYQLVLFLCSPDINVISPRQIRLYVDKDSEITLIASVAFNNKGPSNKNGVIIDQSVTLKFFDVISIELSWHKYVTTLVTDQKLIINDLSNSHAIVVQGGSAEAKEVWYMPRRVYENCSANADCIDRNYLQSD